MNSEKLIERLKAKDFERDYDCTPFECGVFGLLDTAATALSTLQAENAQLRAELERMKKIMRDNGIMTIPPKYPGGPTEWNIPKPRGQKED